MKSSLFSRHAGPRRSAACIGVFDSGIGGLSVLQVLRQRLPASPMVYIGDVAHSPYGDLSASDVLARSHRIVGHLAHLGASTILVACNTATVTSIASLRERWADIAFVGVEPGVKPAAAQSRTRRIAVMATPLTARSARLRELIAAHANGLHVHVQPCTGLASAIERGVTHGLELDALLDVPCAAIDAANIDTLVLGCTHYPFIAEAIQARLRSNVQWVDTAPSIAERVAALTPSADVDEPGGRLRVLSTGSTAIMGQFLARCVGLSHARVEQITL